MGKLEIQGDRLPIAIAAGPIKTRADFKQTYKAPVISLLVPGTYTHEERRNPSPKFIRDNVPLVADNSQKFDNQGKRKLGRHLSSDIRRCNAHGISVMPSVGAGELENAMIVIPELAEWIMEQGANGVEINPVCPNFQSEHPFSFHHHAGELVERVRQRIGDDAVLSVKVPNLSSLVIREIVAADPAVDYWAVNNSFGGLSGTLYSPMFRLNTANWIEALADAGNHRAKVISIGGVACNAEGGREAFDRFRNLGAAFVGMAQHPWDLLKYGGNLNYALEDMRYGWNEAAQTA